MKTKDRKHQIIFIGFVITIFLFICILANQWIEIRKVGKIGKQGRTSLASIENLNTKNEIQNENKISNNENNLETYVISEYSNQALGVSVTKFYGGNPNEVGNFCIAGHNYITKNMFHDLKKLDVSDTFTLVDTNNNKGIYQIYLVETVEPDETQCLSQKTDGKIEVTLITCTTDSSKRIIVKAVKI